MPRAIEIGDAAPDFELPSQDGVAVRLGSYRDRKNVVLYFYPKDETPGCTAEACGFRDQYEAFTDAGAEVIGVSSDSTESHRNFARHHRLPFTLLSDASGQVRKLYGVHKTLGLIPGRVTFVIDKRGVVRHSFRSLTQVDQHLEQALATLRQIA